MVWAIPCSLAATRGITNCFLFLRLLRCFSSPGWLPILRITVLQTARLSHSEIFGSKVICTSPKLIAAYRVLHRLWEPRHPPCALNYFLWSLLIYLNLIVFFLYQYVKEHFSLWKLWRISESNRWPPACKAGALASWANPPIVVSTSNTYRLSIIIVWSTTLVVSGRLELPTSTLSV